MITNFFISQEPYLIHQVISVTTIVTCQEKTTILVVYRKIRRCLQGVHQGCTCKSIGSAIIGKDTSTIGKTTYSTLYVGINIVRFHIFYVHLVVIVGMCSSDTITGIFATSTH